MNQTSNNTTPNPQKASLFGKTGIGVNHNFDLEVIHSYHGTPTSEVESDIYFYHTDHLGSSSWITYTDGSATQHMQNLPFGEPFIDQRATSYDIRYKFTGKEMDSETGYQYFGARYYNSDISVWLSVDPLADKYPSMSSYMYTAGNPVMLIDPDGRKIIFPSIFTDFGWRFQEDLNKLYQGKYGRALIRSIHLMKTKVTIKDASRWYLSDEKDVLNSKTKGDYPNYWQAKDGYISVEYAQKDGIELANTKTASFLILAHEFVHAKDIASGFVDRLNKRIKSGEIVLPKLDFNNEILEVRAMIYTNKIRQEQGIGEVRTEYNGVKLLKDDGVTPIKDYGFNITEGLFDNVEKG